MIGIQSVRARLAPVLLVAAAGILAPTATAHRSGAWQLPPEVAVKLDARGMVGASCTGKGRYRQTGRSTPNRQTWLYKHFECFTYDGIGSPGVLYACVHSRSGRRITVTRSMRNDEYRPCRF